MRLGLIIALMLTSTAVAGCSGSPTRMKTEIVEVPRVDLQVEGAGNRGFLIGTPPAPRTMKTTRHIVETTIELPGLATDVPQPGAEAAPAQMAHPEPVMVQPAVAASGDGYVVKEGETLWSIAAQPDVYGDATQWQAILEANKDQLQNADSVRPGMRLKIPSIEMPQETYNTKGQSFK